MAGKNDCAMAGNGWRETGGGKRVAGNCLAGNGWREIGGGKWMAGNGGGKWVAGNGWREKRSLEMSITFKTNVHHNGKSSRLSKNACNFFGKYDKKWFVPLNECTSPLLEIFPCFQKISMTLYKMVLPSSHNIR